MPTRWYNPAESLAEAIEIEEHALAESRRLAAELAEAIKPIWHWGDGFGGGAMNMLHEAFTAAGLLTEDPLRAAARSETAAKKRREISPQMRRRVYERDEYRCVTCRTHLDLSVDHKVPMARGGTNDFENLQTMCLPCNLKKGVRS